MKTFLLILLISFQSQQVKQYKLIEKHSQRKTESIHGYLAITKDTLYIKEDDQRGRFVVDTTFTFKGHEFTFIARDTVISNESVPVYRGVCIVTPDTKTIHFEYVNFTCWCFDKRRYKYQ